MYYYGKVKSYIKCHNMEKLLKKEDVMFMEKLHKGRQCFYFMEFELVWCTSENKYLHPKVKKELHSVLSSIKEKQNDPEYKIKKIGVYDDYVRLRIEVTPKYNMTNILRGVKGVPAKHILRKFPELKSEQFKDGLWDGSSVVVTPNKDMEKQIENYLYERRIKSCIKLS